MSTATLHDGTLCIDGEVEVLPSTTATGNFYAQMWGCGLGVNLHQAMGPMTPALPYMLTGTGITVSTNGVPCCTQARVLLDNGGVEYCAELTDGQEIPWAMFSTACWLPTQGMPLTAPPASPSVRVRFVPTKAHACPFTNFCITAIHL
jgi:hypothetical protein